MQIPKYADILMCWRDIYFLLFLIRPGAIYQPLKQKRRTLSVESVRRAPNGYSIELLAPSPLRFQGEVKVWPRLCLEAIGPCLPRSLSPVHVLVDCSGSVPDRY